MSIRDLRNEGGQILDSVMRGATVTVTRQGRPIAELRPLRQGTDTFSLERLRADLAHTLDDSL